MSQETKKLVSKEVAILSSILVPISFVLFVDMIKKIAVSKLIKKKIIKLILMIILIILK
jgi:hypothetical protein